MFTALKAAGGDCYRYREVLYHLLARDIKIKYKHTALGYLWSLLNPIFQIAVLAAVFSHLVRWPMKDYTLFLFSGLVAWMFFQTSITMCAISFLENQNFLKKVYLPKVLFPMAKTAFRLLDFVFSLVALTLIAFVAGYSLHATFAFVPAAVLIFFGFTLGVGLCLAVACVFVRDILHIQTVFFQLVYFATPIIYPLSALPEKYRPWMEANPVYIQIRLFQRLIHEGVVPSAPEWGLAVLTSLLALGAGLWMLQATDEELVFRL